MKSFASLNSASMWSACVFGALLIGLTTPSTAVGAPRAVLAEYFNATW